MMNCRNCGKPLEENAKFCVHCGAPADFAPPAAEAPTTYVDYAPAPAPVSKAGKIFSCIGLAAGIVSIISCWIPFFAMSNVEIAGIVFSILGLKKGAKKGLAVTGLILSAVALFVTLIVGFETGEFLTETLVELVEELFPTY